jgi:hypothetical protein
MPLSDLVRVGPSKIDGRGLFALSSIKAGRIIGHLTGELISLREARRPAKGRHRICIVEFDHRAAIDASHGGNELRYMNHSCSPNAGMRITGKTVLFYALSNVNRGDELTCDYGDTHHDGRRECQCGSGKCRGSI